MSVSMLSMLLVLHWFWFFLFCKIVWKSAVGGLDNTIGAKTPTDSKSQNRLTLDDQCGESNEEYFLRYKAEMMGVEYRVKES